MGNRLLTRKFLFAHLILDQKHIFPDRQFDFELDSYGTGWGKIILPLFIVMVTFTSEAFEFTKSIIVDYIPLLFFFFFGNILPGILVINLKTKRMEVERPRIYVI